MKLLASLSQSASHPFTRSTAAQVAHHPDANVLETRARKHARLEGPLIEAPPASPSPFADAARFGNKTANLAILADLVKQHGLHQWVTIPDFIGIEHAAVRAHLEKHCGAKLGDCEKSLQAALARSPKILDADGKNKLGQLRDLIRTTLIDHPLPVDDRWLCGQPNARLMVRSTGREDSAVLANAGGNTSVLNVPANKPAAIATAVAEVVASYLSERSYQQRLSGGDDISAPTFMPVLLQVMVGEVQGGDIPVSGVTLTLEPEGPTPGVSQTQTTYGHNEAVVASLLPCDTYFVQDQRVHSIIKRKPERLAPAADGALQHVANPAELRMRSSLSDVVVQRLHRVGKIVATHYHLPMDLEWTYMPRVDTIYLVQARPLVLPQLREPSHLNPERVHAAQQWTGTVIGAAGGSVRLVESRQQIITAPTLPQALALYLNHPDRASIRGVCVAEAAEATSHEANTFRGVQVPVLYVADFAKFEAFLDANMPLLFDTSMGQWVAASALLGQNETLSLRTLRRRQIILPGWGKHPIPAQQTLNLRAPEASYDDLAALALRLLHDVQPTVFVAPEALHALNTCDKISQASGLETLLRALHAATRPEITQAAPDHGMLRLLFARIAAGSPKERSIAIAQVLHNALQITQIVQRDPALQTRARAVLHGTLHALIRVHEAAQTNSHDISFLFELNFLKASMLQERDADLVDNESFVTLLAEYRERARLRTTDEYLLSFKRVTKLTLRPEVAAAWDDFSAALCRSVDRTQRVQLARLLVDLQTLRVTPLWLTAVFVNAWKNSPGVGVLRAKACLKTLQADAQDTQNTVALKWARAMQDSTHKWRARITDWSTPEAFAGLFKEFGDDLVAQLNRAMDQYDAAHVLGRLAVLAAFAEAVDVFDQTIKSVTGSPHYGAVLTKAHNFQKMLVPYAQLMEPLLRRHPDLAMQKSGYDTPAEGLRCIVNLVASQYFSTPQSATDQLSIRARFNVGAAQVGSGTHFSQHQPERLEEAFTLTHQNLLVLLAALRTRLSLTFADLPDALQALCRATCDATFCPDDEPVSASLVGIENNAPYVTVDLNVRLREHSLKIHLAYDQNHPEAVDFGIKMYGNREHNRAERVMLYAALLAQATGATFTATDKPHYNPEVRTAQWTWRVPLEGAEAQRFNTLWPKVLGDMISTTFNRETLDEMLVKMRQHVPTLDAIIEALPNTFFMDFPWYNHDFLTFQDHQPNASCIKVLAAIYAKPEGHDWVWKDRIMSGTPQQFAALWLCRRMGESKEAAEALRHMMSAQGRSDILASTRRHLPMFERQRLSGLLAG